MCLKRIGKFRKRIVKRVLQIFMYKNPYLLISMQSINDSIDVQFVEVTIQTIIYKHLKMNSLVIYPASRSLISTNRSDITNHKLPYSTIYTKSNTRRLNE